MSYTAASKFNTLDDIIEFDSSRKTATCAEVCHR
jgi:hypothetical protein